MTASLASSSVAVIIPAGGSGRRFGSDQNKIFETIHNRPVWYHTAACFLKRDEVGPMVMALSDSDRDKFDAQRKEFDFGHDIVVAPGGSERFESVLSALNLLDDKGVTLVAIHDAARPCVRSDDLDAVFREAERRGAAILATPVAGSLKRVAQDAASCRHVDRRGLWVAQTPQVFRPDLIRQAYQRHRGFPVTDDAQLVEAAGHPVSLVAGASTNLKITFPEDLRLAEAILKTHV